LALPPFNFRCVGDFLTISRPALLAIGLIYIVVFAAANIFFGSGVSKVSITPFQAIFFAPILWWFVLLCVQSGTIETRFARMNRADNPMGFWLQAGVIAAIGLGFFVWGITQMLTSH
jgi:hypothetical protein